MREWIKQLAEACGPSGAEANVRAMLKELAAPHADEIREDSLGNLIVTKKGGGPKDGSQKKHLLLVAHMDEPGLTVIHAEEEGYLRVVNVGETEAAYWVGRRVAFPNGAVGVVGSEQAESPGEVTTMNLYVDLGVASQAEALQKVNLGDTCTLSTTVEAIGEHRLIGKALDNRVGCAAALQVLQRVQQQAHDVSVVFTAQEWVGSRGIKVAAFGLNPDAAFVLDGVRTGDAPGSARIEIELGAGVAIKVMDKSVIVPPRLKHFLIAQAEAQGIAYQLEVNPDAKSDAGALLVNQAGVPTGGLSIPVRCTGQGAEMVDMRDVEATVQLALAAVQNFSE